MTRLLPPGPTTDAVLWLRIGQSCEVGASWTPVAVLRRHPQMRFARTVADGRITITRVDDAVMQEREILG